MAGLSPYAGRISPLIPGCIGRGGATVNPAQPGPALLAWGGADLGDGTGALLNTNVAANYSAVTTASVAIAGAGHAIIGYVVTASGAASVPLFDNAGTGSSGTVIGVIPSAATATGFVSAGGIKASLGIVYGGGATAPGVTILWS